MDQDLSLPLPADCMCASKNFFKVLIITHLACVQNIWEFAQFENFQLHVMYVMAWFTTSSLFWSCPILFRASWLFQSSLTSFKAGQLAHFDTGGSLSVLHISTSCRHVRTLSRPFLPLAKFRDAFWLPPSCYSLTFRWWEVWDEQNFSCSFKKFWENINCCLRYCTSIEEIEVFLEELLIPADRLAFFWTQSCFQKLAT